MKIKIYNIFLYNLALFSLLYIFLFILYPENSSYFECTQQTEIKKFGVIFNIPISCDLDLYLVGINDFASIHTFDYNYQTRPIYILYMSMFYHFFSLFISNLDLLGLLAFSLGHVIIATSCIVIFLKTLDELKIQYNKKVYLIVVFFGVSPILKWGVFDAAHQTLTLLQFTLSFYFLTKKEKSTSEIGFWSFIIGLLALSNMTFLICLLFLFYEKINRPSKFVVNFSSISIFTILSLIPLIAWDRYISSQGFTPYNAAVEYWKQFIWIKDYILQGYENINFNYDKDEYYCMSVPLFLKCYLSDFVKSLFFLSPIIFLCILNFVSNWGNTLNKLKGIYFNLSFIYIILFVFWSFIGWYPPLRFNLYSLSYFVLFIFTVQILQLEDKVDILFSSSIYFIYFVFLNHWNYLDIININPGIIISFAILIIYTIKKIKDQINITSKL